MRSLLYCVPAPLNAALGLSEVKMDKILKYAVKEAEDKYGKSVSNLKLLPVQFHTNGPYVSYPTIPVIIEDA